MKHNYRELKIWKKARALNKVIYSVTKNFPNDENFGLTSQIRRASVSITSNIAEGSGYDSNLQFLKYLNISLSSLCEVESQLFIALDLEYIDSNLHSNLFEQTEELKKMIIGFKKNLNYSKGSKVSESYI